MAKFETCARTKTFESRILGREFFQREPSKPLFCNNSLLTVHNLYKYHCIVDTHVWHEFNFDTDHFSFKKNHILNLFIYNFTLFFENMNTDL